jgi:hypothetical protein
VSAASTSIFIEIVSIGAPHIRCASAEPTWDSAGAPRALSVRVRLSGLYWNTTTNPDRPGLVDKGMDIEPVPVTGLAANFSPMPRFAPPPFGKEIDGKVLDAPLVGGLEPDRGLSDSAI